MNSMEDLKSLSLSQLDELLEATTDTINCMVYAKVAKEIVKLVKIIKKNHPKFKGVDGGMGTMYTCGVFTVRYLDGDIADGGRWIDQDTEEIDDVSCEEDSMHDSVLDGAIDLRGKTKGVLELKNLMELLEDKNLTGFSGLISDKGVTFEFIHEESKLSSRGNKISKIKSDGIYKALVTLKVPVIFKPRMTEWKHIGWTKAEYVKRLKGQYERSTDNHNKSTFLSLIEDANLYEK